MSKIALLSTNEPQKIVVQCRKLVNLGWRLIATNETVKVMRKESIPIIDVEQFTGVGYDFGIPPTLHPKIEQALTDNCREPIDLVFDIPYSLVKGNDVGGRTLLALGAKGRRLVINNYEDLEKVVSLLEQKSNKLNEIRDELIAKVNFEISKHYLSLAKKYSKKYEGILGEYKMTCKEGENPYQVPCELFVFDQEDPLAISKFSQVSGESMCFTNVADFDNIVATMEKLKRAFLLNCKKLPFIVVAAKHGNPCGVGVDWTSKKEAIDKALWGNPQAIWGGEAICNFEIDKNLALALFRSQKRKEILGVSDWMLDIIVATKFYQDAITILGKRKYRKLVVNPHINKNSSLSVKNHFKFICGGYLRQIPNDYILKFDEIDWSRPSKIDKDSLIIAWATSYTSFHGGNEISIAKDSMLIGVGGGPSTLMAAQHAVQWAKYCKHEAKGAVFCADAFFPFTDAPKILVKAGCKGGVVPGGGKNHSAISKYFRNKAILVGFIPERYRGFCRH